MSAACVCCSSRLLFDLNSALFLKRKISSQNRNSATSLNQRGGTLTERQRSGVDWHLHPTLERCSSKDAAKARAAAHAKHPTPPQPPSLLSSVSQKRTLAPSTAEANNLKKVTVSSDHPSANLASQHHQLGSAFEGPPTQDRLFPCGAEPPQVLLHRCAPPQVWPSRHNGAPTPVWWSTALLLVFRRVGPTMRQSVRRKVLSKVSIFVSLVEVLPFQSVCSG